MFRAKASLQENELPWRFNHKPLSSRLLVSELRAAHHRRRSRFVSWRLGGTCVSVIHSSSCPPTSWPPSSSPTTRQGPAAPYAAGRSGRGEAAEEKTQLLTAAAWRMKELRLGGRWRSRLLDCATSPQQQPPPLWLPAMQPATSKAPTGKESFMRRKLH